MKIETSDFEEKKSHGKNQLLTANQYDVKYAVKCTNGTFVGRNAASKNVKEYLGIPYAQAPVGSLRWQPRPSDNKQRSSGFYGKAYAEAKT